MTPVQRLVQAQALAVVPVVGLQEPVDRRHTAPTQTQSLLIRMSRQFICSRRRFSPVTSASDSLTERSTKERPSERQRPLPPTVYRGGPRERSFRRPPRKLTKPRMGMRTANFRSSLISLISRVTVPDLIPTLRKPPLTRRK